MAEEKLSGWTRHGHRIKGMVQIGTPKAVARCGGPGMCGKCSREATAEIDHPTPLTPDPAPAVTEGDVGALRERLAEYERAWLWNAATDNEIEGWGYHIGQMLYRLPRDSQTEDMQESIESIIADTSALLASLEAARVESAGLRERVREVEGERDAARNVARRDEAEKGRMWQALRDRCAAEIARAESAEAAHAALVAGVEGLADEWERDSQQFVRPHLSYLSRLAEQLRALLLGGAQ